MTQSKPSADDGVIAPTLQFRGSPEPTLGIEVELQVIDPTTRNLIQAVPQILAAIEDDRHYKPELIRSNLEINTDVCRTIREARENLCTLMQQLLTVCDRLGYAIACAGTHPFAHWKDQAITENPRYLALVERHGWVCRRLAIFGIHYHIGVPNGEQAIAILNALMAYIPHLLALSASSPFWIGRDTGLQSTRSKIFESLNTAGLPYPPVNWNEFVWFVRTLIAAGSIETFREIWWDIRPHPLYGTVEIRVCDSIPRVSDIIAMAAFVQTLVVDLGRRYDAGEQLTYLPRWIVQENKWRAARFGMDARLICDRNAAQVYVRDAMAQLLDTLLPTARQIGADIAWPHLYARLDRPTAADEMRDWYRDSGDLRTVVDRLVQVLRDDLHEAARQVQRNGVS